MAGRIIESGLDALRSVFSGHGEQIDPPRPNVDDLDFWIDPDPQGEPGILLSDRIKYYVQKVNLIYPFDETELRPASYTLHAGSEYLISLPGKLVAGNLQEEKKVLIPTNGLIYIRFWEEVNIPYYMIARFNLRVKQVYRGLLLGTGPQVDPGFRGHLGCPIHNFTDEDKLLHFRERLVTIDFEKTTPFGETSFRRKTRAELEALNFDDLRRGKPPVLGIDGHRCLLFKEVQDRPLQEYLPGGESVKSSVLALQNDVNRLKGEWTLFRRIAIGGAIVGLLAAGAITFDAYRDLKNDITHVRESIAKLKGAAGTAPATAVQPQPSQPPARVKDESSKKP